MTSSTMPPLLAPPSISRESEALLMQALERKRIFRKVRRIAYLVLAVLLAIPFQWIVRKAAVQIGASSKLGSAGGDVTYTFDSSNWLEGGESFVAFAHPTIFDRQAKAEDLLAIDSLHRVTSLDLSRFQRPPSADFGFLKNLTELNHLYVDRSQQTWQGAGRPEPFSNDLLVPVPNLVRLKTLDLAGNRITDAGLAKLSGLTRLEELNLSSTLVTDAGLTRLTRLPSLLRLNLTGSRVTAAGVAQLRLAMPTVEIEFDPKTRPFFTE